MVPEVPGVAQEWAELTATVAPVEPVEPVAAEGTVPQVRPVPMEPAGQLHIRTVGMVATVELAELVAMER